MTRDELLKLANDTMREFESEWSPMYADDTPRYHVLDDAICIASEVIQANADGSLADDWTDQSLADAADRMHKAWRTKS